MASDYVLYDAEKGMDPVGFARAFIKKNGMVTYSVQFIHNDGPSDRDLILAYLENEVHDHIDKAKQLMGLEESPKGVMIDGLFIPNHGLFGYKNIGDVWKNPNRKATE